MKTEQKSNKTNNYHNIYCPHVLDYKIFQVILGLSSPCTCGETTTKLSWTENVLCTSGLPWALRLNYASDIIESFAWTGNQQGLHQKKFIVLQGLRRTKSLFGNVGVKILSLVNSINEWKHCIFSPRMGVLMWNWENTMLRQLENDDAREVLLKQKQFEIANSKVICKCFPCSILWLFDFMIQLILAFYQ